jgi:hypothetical protein
MPVEPPTANALEHPETTMRLCRQPLRSPFIPALAAALWLMAEQPASAQVLLAQSGAAKTGIGWLIVLLGVGLGLIAVCRPSVRKGDKRKWWA